RPLGELSLVPAAEVAVAVDEVADGVAVLFQRAKHLRVGRHPVRGGDDALEAEVAQEAVRLLVKAALALQQEAYSVPVARRPVVGHVPERTEADAPLGRVVTRDLGALP